MGKREVTARRRSAFGRNNCPRCNRYMKGRASRGARLPLLRIVHSGEKLEDTHLLSKYACNRPRSSQTPSG